MSHGQLVATLGCAALGLLASPYLARLTLTVPDRDRVDWWRGAPPGRGRLAATAAVAVVLSALAGRSAGWTALLPAYVLLALCCAPLAVIDVEHHRLPNRLVFLAAGGALVLLTAAAAQRHDWHAWLRGAEAAGVVFALFYAIALLATFGWGDVKLGGLLAGYLGLFGWGYVLYGILAGFVLAAAFSLPMVLVRRVSMKTAIPLGPSLIVGALLVTAFRLVPATLA